MYPLTVLEAGSSKAKVHVGRVVLLQKARGEKRYLSLPVAFSVPWLVTAAPRSLPPSSMVSPCVSRLSLIMTFVIAFRVQPDNPG